MISLLDLKMVVVGDMKLTVIKKVFQKLEGEMKNLWKPCGSNARGGICTAPIFIKHELNRGTKWQ